MPARPLHAAIPSVDRVLRSDAIQPLIESHGRTLVAGAVRDVLAHLPFAAPEGVA